MKLSVTTPDAFPRRPRRRYAPNRRLQWKLALIAAASYSCLLFQYHSHSHVVSRARQCTISNLHRNLSFLDPAVPIESSEFIHRRDRLAQALQLSGVDAFVLEPGYTFQYYGNVSQTDWEPWEPEERPMLMVIQPKSDDQTSTIKAKTSFLSPHFEEGRVRMLGIPSVEALDIVTWEEHWDPYQTLWDSHLFRDKEHVKLMVDEEMRDYIVRGLAASGFETVGLGGEVEAVRQTKSPAEIELIRAVNTGTVEALRAMRPCLVSGLIEDEVMNILDSAILSIGFGLFFDIVLFEENGALPHGGFVTGKKVLKEDSMVLIDVGAHYLGYSSDVCRSFLIPPSSDMPLWRKILAVVALAGWPKKQEGRDSELFAEKLRVWDIVMDAQTESAKMFVPNNTAASVDIAARGVISKAGYSEMFTHRVGHGIGIKAHESPYLNQGNDETILVPGMTFTSEPGIYLEGKFGVRHEDIYLVREDDYPELLSGKRASSPYEP